MNSNAQSLGTSLLPAGLREAQPCRYCCPDKREIWHGGSAPRCHKKISRATFHVYRGINVGIQPLKLSKFRTLVINLPFMGHSFAQFLRISHILYMSIGSF